MRRELLALSATLLAACSSAPQDAEPDTQMMTISGEVHSSYEDGDELLAGATVHELGNPANSDVTDAEGRWVLEVPASRFVGATVQADGFLEYSHIVDVDYALSSTPEVTLKPFADDTLTELYSGDYGYDRQRGDGTLVVMIADPSGADYTGAQVNVGASYEESLVENANSDLIPGSVSGEPWAEVIFVNVEPGTASVDVVAPGGDSCLAGLDVAVAADTYVYVDTGCPD